MRSTVLVILVAMLLLSACGGSSATFTGEAAKPVAQIISDAKNAVRSAQSVHKLASMTYRGKTYPNELTMAGPHSFSGSYLSANNPVKFVIVGRDTYVSSTLPWWEAYVGAVGAPRLQRVILRLAGGLWGKNPASWWINRPAPMLITPSQTFERMLSWAGPFTKNDGETTYAGRKLITLESRHAKLYLLPGHGDYPVALVWDGPASHGRTYHVTFDHWNAPLSVSVPQHAYDLKGRG